MIDFNNADFRDAIMGGGGAGGFQIDKNEVFVKHRGREM